MVRFKVESNCAFAKILRAARAAFYRSNCLAVDTVGPRNIHSEEDFLNMSADGTTCLGLRVS